ncbi:hypothetical protein ACOMHN_062144 [Nucella lapillus]
MSDEVYMLTSFARDGNDPGCTRVQCARCDGLGQYRGPDSGQHSCGCNCLTPDLRTDPRVRSQARWRVWSAGPLIAGTSVISHAKQHALLSPVFRYGASFWITTCRLGGLVACAQLEIGRS